MKQLYVSSRDVKKDEMRSQSLNSPLTSQPIDVASHTFNPAKQKTTLIDRWNNLPASKKIGVWALVVGAILLIGVVSFYIIVIREGSQKPIKLAQTLIYSESTPLYLDYSNQFSYLKIPSVPRDAENPINGELYTQDEMKEIKKHPPLAVMIENHTAARPQSGLDKADVVYEALAEGGITRFMGIFWGHSAKVLGPIRSARVYFIEMLSEYDAIYMHIGGAQGTGNPRVDAIPMIYRYGIHNLDTGGSFYRDRSRNAPHNAYSSTATLWGISDKRGWSSDYTTPTAWKFKRDAKPADRGDNTVALIRFLTGLANGGAYDTQWVYDKKTNLYYRVNGGLTHKDKETGLQYTAKNVVIQSVKLEFHADGHAHVIQTIIGSGNAKILQDGKVIDGTWSKASRTARTIFKDKSGKEIEFNRGQTWIEMYPYQYGSLKITQ